MNSIGKLPSILPATSINKPDAANVAARNKSIEAPSAGSPAAGDPVSLSPQAREFHAARAAIAVMPEIREEKVAAIRAQIEAGTYEVDSEKIAGRMIEDALFSDHPK